MNSIIGKCYLEQAGIDGPRPAVLSWYSDLEVVLRLPTTDAGRALLEEDLNSPCTEEIAVFRGLADAVAKAKDQIVVLDTAFRSAGEQSQADILDGHLMAILAAAEATEDGGLELIVF